MLKRFLKNICILFLVGSGVFISCSDMVLSATKTARKSGGSTAKNSSKKKNSSPAKRAAGTTKRAATGTSSSASATNTRRNASSSSSSTASKNVTLSDTATNLKKEQQACREAFVSCMDAQIKDIIDKYTYLYDDDAVQAYLETGEPFRCLFYDVKNTNLPQNMQVISSCRSVLNEATISSFNISQADMNSLISQYPLYLTSAQCSSSGDATLNINSTAKTGICSSCTTYKTLDAFLSSNSSVNTAWKNYKSLCKEKALVEKYKNETDFTKADAEYKNFVYENCSSRDVNDLYFSYNYYCDLRSSTLKNAIGVKTNYCKLSSEENNTSGLTGEAKVRAEIANVFGTTSSSEYYKEALTRLEAGELRMVNFKDSNFYKQKIDGLGLETLKMYDISSLLNTSTKCEKGYRYNAAIGACQRYNDESGLYEDAGLSNAEFVAAKSSTAGTCPSEGDIFDGSSKKCVRCSVNSTWNSDVRKCQSNSVAKNVVVKAQEEEEKDARSIYTDLGIDRDSSLFSINVVPPLGSGLVFPSALFNKAVTYCFDGQKKRITGVSAALKEKYSAFNKNKETLAACSELYKDDLERYYLAGYWPKDEVEPASDGTYSTDTDYEELDFMSAKKACDIYEQNLISVRNNNYAKFDTQIKNYLEDALAVILKNEIKNISTLADIGTTLQKDDSDRTLNRINAEAERANAKAESELEMMELEQKQLEEQREADRLYLENQKKAKEAATSNYATPIISACGNLGKTLFDQWKGTNQKTASSLTEALSKMYIKIDASGNIVPYTDATYSTLPAANYSEISCAEVNGFYSSSSYVALLNSITDFFKSKIVSATVINEYKDAASGSGSLSAGLYKIQIAGAGGGGGGGTKCAAHCKGTGGTGGNGDLQTTYMYVTTSMNYSYTVGAGGRGGDKGKYTGKCYSGTDNAAAGGQSTFKFDGVGSTYTASGGNPATSAKIGSSANCKDGSNGSNAGNGLGGKGGSGEKGLDNGNPGSAGWVRILLISSWR